MMKCRQTDMTDGLTDRRGSNKHTDRWTDKSIGVTINIQYHLEQTIVSGVGCYLSRSGVAFIEFFIAFLPVYRFIISNDKSEVS